MGERILGAPDFFKGLKDIEGKIRCVPHNAKGVEPGIVGGASGTQTSSGQGSIWGSQCCRGLHTVGELPATGGTYLSPPPMPGFSACPSYLLPPSPAGEGRTLKLRDQLEGSFQAWSEGRGTSGFRCLTHL